MVEEMIAEGMSPDEIVTVLEEQFGMTSGDAELLVDTALGGPGDLLTDEEPPDAPSEPS